MRDLLVALSSDLSPLAGRKVELLFEGKSLDPTLSIEDLAKEGRIDEGGRIHLGFLDPEEPGDEDPERDPLADTHIDDSAPTDCIRRSMAEAATQVVRRSVIPALPRSNDPDITRARTEAIARKRIENESTDVVWPKNKAPEGARVMQPVEEEADTEIDVPVKSFTLRYPSRMELGRAHELKLLAGPVERPQNYRLLPRIPGCLVSPVEAQLALGSAGAEATFWITPMVSGTLPRGEIELYLGIRRLGKASFEMAVISRRASRAWLVVGLLLPWLGALAGLLEPAAENEASALPLLFRGLLGALRPAGGPEVALGVLGLVAIGIGLWLRSKSRTTTADDVFAMRY